MSFRGRYRRQTERDTFCHKCVRSVIAHFHVAEGPISLANSPVDPHSSDVRLGSEFYRPWLSWIRQADGQAFAFQAVYALTRFAGVRPRLRRETDRRRSGQWIDPASPTHFAQIANALLVKRHLQNQPRGILVCVQDDLPILLDQTPGAAQLLASLGIPPSPAHRPGARGAENGPADRPYDQAQRLFFCVGKPAKAQSQHRENRAPQNALNHSWRVSSARRLKGAWACLNRDQRGHLVQRRERAALGMPFSVRPASATLRAKDGR